jgi:hypothetical protein
MSRIKRPARRVTVQADINGRLVRPGGVTEVATELGMPLTTVTTWITRKQTNDQGQQCPGVLLGPFAMGPVYNVDDWCRWRGVPVPTGAELDALAAEYAAEDEAAAERVA